MRDRITVQHDGMASLATSLRGAQQSIADELAGLEEQVRLLRGQWTGEASRAFERARSEWTVELRRMGAVLGEAVALAEGGAGAHRATEARVAALW